MQCRALIITVESTRNKLRNTLVILNSNNYNNLDQLSISILSKHQTELN